MSRGQFRIKALGFLLGAGFLLAAFTGPAVAEPKKDWQQYAEKRMQKMTSELDLTEAQVSQIKQIMERRKPEMKALRGQMKEVFTEEQRAAMKDRWKNRERGERPSKDQWQQNLQELGVTPEQQQQMKANRERLKQQAQQTREEISAVLTPEQRQKFEQMKSERRGKRGKRGQRGHGGQGE